MKVSGRILESDMVDSYFLSTNRPKRKMNPLGGLSLVILGLALAYIDPSYYLLYLLIAAFLAVLMFWGFFSLWGPARTKRLFHELKTFENEKTFELRDDGLLLTDIHTHALTPWSHIHKWRANERIIMLYLSSYMFYPIPRRLFSSDADYQNFADAIRAKLGPETVNGTFRYTSPFQPPERSENNHS